MQLLLVLAAVPALGLVLMGATITYETWIGGRTWKS